MFQEKLLILFCKFTMDIKTLERQAKNDQLIKKLPL